MKNADTRVQYTKSVLKKALLELMKKKQIGKITVKEICEEAGLNRGTFYLHYDSPNTLLLDIEEEFMRENLAIFESFWKDQYDFRIMDAIFYSLEKHKDIYRILMGVNGDPQFLRSIIQKARPTTIEGWMREWPNAKKENVEMVFDYVFTGVSALIINWLNGEYEVSAKELSARIERFGHYAMVASLES